MEGEGAEEDKTASNQSSDTQQHLTLVDLYISKQRHLLFCAL